jgi:putative tricarboxylic transport membrane protein
MVSKVDFVVHGPPGSAPPVLAEAFVAGVHEAEIDGRDWRLVPRGDDPGVDAMQLLASRPGDANLLSTCTPVFLQAPILRGMPLTHRALTPLARLVLDRYFLVVRADAPWTDAASFLVDIGRRTTRTGGYFKGGINHLLGLSIAEKTGADVEFVVTSSEPAVWVGLIDGSLDWGCGVAAEILPHVEAGTLRVLATLDDERRPRFSQVPTLAEVGAHVSFRLWRGLMGPPGLSAADQARWHEIGNAVRRTQVWQAYLIRQGQEDSFLPGDAFRAFLDEEWDWYERHYGLAGLLPNAPVTA